MKVTSEAKPANPEALNQVLGNTNETAVAVRGPVALGTISGGVGSTALNFPLLQIAYGVGKLAEKFSNGDWVLDKDYLLAKKGEPLVVTFVHVETYLKQYIDKSKYVPGVQAKRYYTRKEALDAGEIVDWPPKGSDLPRPTVSPAGTYMLMIQKPKGLECALFGFPIKDELWTPARMFLDKKAHKIVFDTVNRMSTFSLAARKGGLVSGQFVLTTGTKVNPFNGNTETLPAIKFLKAHDDADVDRILGAYSNALQAAKQALEEEEGDAPAGV
jgi:hypothetical protein